MARIFHIALAREWAEARSRGNYQTSTLGTSLEQEGFIHASRREQVGPVFHNYYRGVREPLVLLTIDTDRLAPPWQEDPVGDDTFPHIYGPLNVGAVVNVQPLNRRGGTDPFLVIFFRQAIGRIALALGVMALAVLGASLGGRSESDWGPLLGALAGLALGGVLIAVVVRTRARR